MNRLLILIMLVALFAQCNKGNQSLRATETIAKDSCEADSIPFGAAILLKVYPDCIIAYKNDSLVMSDGTRIIYDDHQEKDFETMLNHSSPKDMFSMRYDTTVTRPAYLADAGRSRCEQLFKAMYGNSAAEVQKQMVRVEWFGQRILFSSTNGCADSLKAIANEIAMHKEYLPYVSQASTFYWRKVRGAQRQSAHSYGIAIDINVAHSNYWLWSNKGAKETDKIEYENRIPLRLVNIFEKHGFIWGGRWYHYDTMHFEFRPELHYTLENLL